MLRIINEYKLEYVLNQKERAKLLTLKDIIIEAIIYLLI